MKLLTLPITPSGLRVSPYPLSTCRSLDLDLHDDFMSTCPPSLPLQTLFSHHHETLLKCTTLSSSIDLCQVSNSSQFSSFSVSGGLHINPELFYVSQNRHQVTRITTATFTPPPQNKFPRTVHAALFCYQTTVRTLQDTTPSSIASHPRETIICQWHLKP